MTLSSRPCGVMVVARYKHASSTPYTVVFRDRTVNRRQGPQQGTKPASDKIANFSSYSYSYSRYCSINNTNELRLLVSMCFWVKKESTGGQISSKNNVTLNFVLVQKWSGRTKFVNKNGRSALNNFGRRVVS